MHTTTPDPTPTTLTDAHRAIRVNNIAVDLCNADDTYDHHDQTDDHPCSRCLRYAETTERLVAAGRADERERLIARLRGLASDLAQPADAGVDLADPSGVVQ